MSSASSRDDTTTTGLRQTTHAVPEIRVCFRDHRIIFKTLNETGGSASLRLAPFNIGESGKLIKNLTNSIDAFNGQQSRFEDWSDNTKICFQSWYPPLISEIIDGKERPPEVIG